MKAKIVTTTHHHDHHDHHDHHHHHFRSARVLNAWVWWCVGVFVVSKNRSKDKVDQVELIDRRRRCVCVCVQTREQNGTGHGKKREREREIPVARNEAKMKGRVMK